MAKISPERFMKIARKTSLDIHSVSTAMNHAVCHMDARLYSGSAFFESCALKKVKESYSLLQKVLAQVQFLTECEIDYEILVEDIDF